MHWNPKVSRVWGVVLALALEVALVIGWSAGFIGVRFAMDYAPTFSILMWRSAISGLLLLPIAVFWGPRMRRRDVLEQVAFGSIAMASYLGCYSMAIQYGAPTGIVALITDLLPLMMALLSWPMLQQKLTGRQWIGSAVGVIGVLVASNVSMRMGNAPMWAFGLPVLGTALFALATLLQRNSHSRQMPIHQQLCIQFLSAAAAYAPLAWLQNGLLPTMAPKFIVGILWLVFVGTFATYGLYYAALRQFTPARVTAVLYASPPLTLIWAWLMFDEPMTINILIGLAISLIGFLIFAIPKSAQKHS